MSSTVNRVSLDSPLMRARLKNRRIEKEYLHRNLDTYNNRVISDFIVKRRPINYQYSRFTETQKLNIKPKEVVKLPVNGLEQSSVLKHQSVQTSSKKLKKANYSKMQVVLVALAVVMIGFGAYLTLDGYRANVVAQAQASKLVTLANKTVTDNNLNSSKTTISKNNVNTPVPATVKPTNYSIADYTVSPNLPKYINIPRFGVHARIFSVGTLHNGALQTPYNVYDTDWYNGSSLPGQPGAMLIDGHVSSWTTQGVFYNIRSLAPGDIIQIVRGDNTIFNYKVVKQQIYSSNNVDMTAAVTPIVPSQPGLNLISCTGDVISGTNLFNARVVVFATLVN